MPEEPGSFTTRTMFDHGILTEIGGIDQKLVIGGTCDYAAGSESRQDT